MQETWRVSDSKPPIPPSALKRSGPNTVFAATVLTALPGIGAATASTATAGGVKKAAVAAGNDLWSFGV